MVGAVIMPRGNPKQCTIANLATQSDEIDFEGLEFTRLKISPVSITGLTTTSAISLRASGRTVLNSSGAPVSMTWTTTIDEFVWLIELDAPLNKISLALGIAATDDIVFQVTAYAPNLP